MLQMITKSADSVRTTFAGRVSKMEQALQENEMKVGQFRMNLIELQAGIDKIGQGVTEVAHGQADSVPASAVQSVNARVMKLEKQQVELE